MLHKQKYVDVIIPLPLDGYFTYHSNNLEIKIGQRVVVQFGRVKLYSALVSKIHFNKPEKYTPKPILSVIDEVPIVNSVQLEFWKWISKYYMSNIGDVMNNALPNLFKLTSESQVVINNSFDGDIENMSNDEIKFISILTNNDKISIQQIRKHIDKSILFKVLSDLIDKEVIYLREDIKSKYKAKKRNHVMFCKNLNLQKNVSLTPKQQKFLDKFYKLQSEYISEQWSVSKLLDKLMLSRSILDSLIKKEILKIEVKEISRLNSFKKTEEKTAILSDFQLKAFLEVKSSFEKRDVCLLHGVTSSGKTEIYIKLIEEQLKNKKQVLYLLPEIALTTQIITRLVKHFGSKVGIYHSNLNNSERVEVWKNLIQHENQLKSYSIIIGARSSIWLPFSNLGLVIVDEEHDSSYKQTQQSPRYHARDAAIVFASLYNSKVILGSATPSIETYFNTVTKKYGLVEMTDRYLGLQLPEIKLVDIRKAKLKNEMTFHFSKDLINQIDIALNKKHQVILFQNRRGFSTIYSCNDCSEVIKCNRCDVTLTYHKGQNHLRCHYCGYIYIIPKVCKNCNGKNFSNYGFGTEQIQENLSEIFPKSNIFRLDYDTTRSKNAYSKIISDFEKSKIDILVGTQMVSKGLDFDNVSLVAIISADNMLNYPDFRSYEKALQTMIQVSGRAGRKNKDSRVIIQTYNPYNKIYSIVKDSDYKTYFNQEICERKSFNYPPFCKLIKIIIKSKRKDLLDIASFEFAALLRKTFSNRILGPEYPNVSRVKNFYIKNLLLKIENTHSFSKAKEILFSNISSLKQDDRFKSIRITLDVDPI